MAQIVLLLFSVITFGCSSAAKKYLIEDTRNYTIANTNYMSANYSYRKFDIRGEYSNINLIQMTYGHLIADVASNFIFGEMQIASKKIDIAYGNDFSLFAIGHLGVMNMYYLGFGLNYSDLKTGKIQPAWNPTWKFGVLWNQTSIKEFWKIFLGYAYGHFCQNDSCFTYKIGEYGYDIITEFGSYYGGRSQNPQVFFTNIGLRLYF